MGGLFKREKITCSHILVDDMAAAQKILIEIRKGADFRYLALSNSKCPSKANGGDLPPFGKGEMVAEFEKVAWNLEVGQVSEPVKTKFGYHIIKRTG